MFDFYYLDAPREKLYSHYASLALANGWQRTKAEEFMGHEIYDFVKDKFRFNLQLGGIGPNANFATSCEDGSTYNNNP